MDDTTSQIAKAALAGFMRHQLTTAAGALVAAGALQSDQTNSFVTIGSGVVLWTAGCLWSWWQKVGQKAALEKLAALKSLPQQAASKAVPKAVIGFFLIAGALAFALSFPAHAMAAQPSQQAINAALKEKITKHDTAHPTRYAQAASKSAISGSSAAVPAKSAALSTAQVTQNPLLLLQSFTVSDLQAAIALANAQTPPDTIAAACYQALLTMVQNINGPSIPSGGQVGAFYAFQQARDAKAFALNILSPNGPATALNNACAPLVVDAQNTLLMMGVAVGAVANPVGGAATVAGLPAAVAAFLAVLPK